MKTSSSLPLNKNPAWINMAHYDSFNDALEAMRYYEMRYERWLALRAKVRATVMKFWVKPVTFGLSKS